MAGIWEQYASYFPVRNHLVYVNHAAVSPLCKPAADAIRGLAEEACQFGSFYYDRWLATYKGLREVAARLIHASPGEIALVKNTSEGISVIASGMRWRAGDVVVAFEEEFPSNYFPWKRLEQRGVVVRWLSETASLEEIDAACEGARFLSISFVQYLSGYRANLAALGEICARRGVFFFVDAIQGMGAFPIDVEAMRIDALAADGHKWMMGPEGCGLLYVRASRQEEIEPQELGWMSVANAGNFSSGEIRLRKDAGRYECGTLNTAGCYGLRAALEFIEQVGVDHIRCAVQRLGDDLYRRLADRGMEMLGARTAENGAGIVSFRKPGESATATLQTLKDNGILAAARQDWVRVSPHFYVTPAEIDHLMDSV